MDARETVRLLRANLKNNVTLTLAGGHDLPAFIAKVDGDGATVTVLDRRD